mmetsp:Transcript_10451/g.20020  ORF Transcript_10451/g.20020 Transcript_10451/m.20020 type:complete len:202 (-) Transcript_10451:700-1305(-)
MRRVVVARRAAVLQEVRGCHHRGAAPQPVPRDWRPRDRLRAPVSLPGVEAVAQGVRSRRNTHVQRLQRRRVLPGGEFLPEHDAERDALQHRQGIPASTARREGQWAGLFLGDSHESPRDEAHPRAPTGPSRHRQRRRGVSRHRIRVSGRPLPHPETRLREARSDRELRRHRFAATADVVGDRPEVPPRRARHSRRQGPPGR